MNVPHFSRQPMLGRWMSIVNLATAGASLLVASMILILFQYVSLRDALLEDVNVQARIIGENSGAALMFNDARASNETLAALAASSNIDAAAIFTMDNQPLGAYRRDGVALVAPPSSQLLASGHQFSIGSLEVVRRIEIDGREVGLVVVRARLEQLYKRLASYVGLTLSVALGSLAVAYLLVARMRRFVKNAEAHLHYLAHTDSVTGLPNRHAFNEQISAALDKVDQFGGCTGLLFLDLDNFKNVNDSLGHHSGDILLKQVAQRLNESLRANDVLCRIGGDEFAIIFEHGGASDSASMSEKVMSALSAPFMIDIHELYVTASIGTSIYPDDADDPETLTRNADTAMYHAKAKGKNAFEQFHPELKHRLQRRVSLESSLRKALERGELELYYQPIVSLHDGKLAGVEAMLRWHHPVMGLVNPTDFIPIAENSGLIVSIGRWVLRTACQQVAAWRDAGLGDIHVSINLSGRHARDSHLVEDILTALHEAAMAPEQLELEITESVLRDSAHINVELLHHLQAEGIRLSIDDFGTGYSSMASLKRFPIDQIKIDRSFVHDIPGDADDKAIVAAIIAMAHNLGLTVVAEGVETEKQLHFLRDAGCDKMQGYYCAEPRPADKVTAFLKRRVALLH